MLFLTENRVLELLFDDLTKEYTILEISRVLKSPYSQTHRAVKSLIKRGLISHTKIGKASVIGLKLTEIKKEYIFAELERCDRALKMYAPIRVVFNCLEEIANIQFICIVFGSYAKKKPTPKSDVDLLFIIPKEYDYGAFERNVRNILIASNTDINIVFDDSMLEMWKTPQKLNIGNELLKGHIILRGAEAFLELRKRHYVG